MEWDPYYRLSIIGIELNNFRFKIITNTATEMIIDLKSKRFLSCEEINEWILFGTSASSLFLRSLRLSFYLVKAGYSLNVNSSFKLTVCYQNHPSRDQAV